MKFHHDCRREFMLRLNCHMTVSRAKGCYLYDQNAQPYADCLSQYGAVPFGHNPDAINQVVHRYLMEDKPIFVQPFDNEQKAQLITRLLELIPGDFHAVRLCNSGTEAVEMAIKAARFRTSRKHVISVSNGFHGKTFAALSASGSDRYRNEFTADAESYHSFSTKQLVEICAFIKTHDVAAFIFEPILGEGGMAHLPLEFLTEVVSCCRDNGVLVIADEVQTGMGRCGEIIYSPCLGIQPDLVCLSKGLSGGVIPIGAVLINRKAYSKEFDIKHSSTFANSGLAAVTAQQVLTLLTDDDCDFLKKVKQKSLLVEQLANNLLARYGQHIGFSGAGLMRGLHFKAPPQNKNYVTTYTYNSGALAYIFAGYLMHRHHLIMMPLLSQNCALRFQPALNMPDELIKTCFKAIEDLIEHYVNERYDILFAHVIDKPVSSLLSKPFVSQFNLARLSAIERNTQHKFAFLIHATSLADMVRLLPESIKVNYTEQEQEKLASQFLAAGSIYPNPDVSLRFSVANPLSTSNGLMIFSPLSPRDMMRLNEVEKSSLMKAYLKIAKEEGATVVGLGAYTSVITRGGELYIKRYPGLKLTTGNSLTALSCINKATEQFLHLPDKSISIIGPHGSVARICVLFLAGKFGQMTLVGRKNTAIERYQPLLMEMLDVAQKGAVAVDSGSVLSWLLAAYQTQSDCAEQFIDSLLNRLSAEQMPLRIEDDALKCIKDVDCIISATSHGKPFLDPASLKPGCIAIDAARPFDFEPRLNVNDVKVLEGGVVKQPELHSYGDCNLVGLPDGFNLACLSETILLSLADLNQDSSLGNSIPPNEVVSISDLAKTHSFSF